MPLLSVEAVRAVAWKTLLSVAALTFQAPAPAAAGEALESAMQQEFEASGAAMRSVLEQLALGDEAGASEAERAHQAHRSRFLELKRRLEPAPHEPSSEAPPRSPFAPDAGWPAKTADPGQVPSAGWDLYALSKHDKRPKSWGMYGSDKGEIQAPDAAGLPTRMPFLVYRTPTAPQSHAPGDPDDAHPLSTVSEGSSLK